MYQSKWTMRRSILLVTLFVGVFGEPIFFYGRGKEISRKRSFHPFSPRTPAHRPPPPPNRVPCVPNYAPRTKYVTKTTSVYKTVYETAFFPKTVFDTNFKSAAFDLEPSTVTKTSTTTSTVLKTKVEPVYVPTTEFETTSMTSTITHLVYDTRQQISSLLHTRLAPEVLTKTIVQDVYHTDVETVFSSRTVTVTRTESVVNSDCPALPSSSSNRPLSSNFDPRGKFNRDHLRAAYLHGPLDSDPYSDITHANSEPLKSFAGPLPINEFDGKATFSPLHVGAPNSFSPVDPFSFHFNSPYIGSYVPQPYTAFPFPDNKLLNSFSPSHLNSNRFQNYLPDGDYSSRYHSVAKSPVSAYSNDDETDDYMHFTSKDIKFAPSRPDPTSISDIIDDSYGSQEEKDDHSYTARQPKLLLANEESLYGTKSIYGPRPKDYPKPFRSDSLYKDDYSDYGDDIHIKEVLEGVKGGEIHEEVHQHGIVQPSHAPLSTVLDHFGSHVSKYSGSYHDSPPVYEYKNIDSHYSTSLTSKPPLLLDPQYDPSSKQIHPLVPKEIEYNGFVKSPSESIDRHVHAKPPGADAVSRNLNSFAVSVQKPDRPRTLFRSEVLESKRIDPEERSRSFRGMYGAHSMPIVTNLAGTEFIDLYKNTSSNTYTAPTLNKFETENGDKEITHYSNAEEILLSGDSIGSNNTKQAGERKSYNFYEKNDWMPLVPFESLKTNNDLHTVALKNTS